MNRDNFDRIADKVAKALTAETIPILVSPKFYKQMKEQIAARNVPESDMRKYEYNYITALRDLWINYVGHVEKKLNFGSPSPLRSVLVLQNLDHSKITNQITLVKRYMDKNEALSRAAFQKARGKEDLRHFINENWSNIHKAGKELIKFLESWLPVNDMVNEARKYITIEKPKPKQKPKSKPKPRPKKGMSAIKKALGSTIQKMKSKFIKQETDLMISVAKEFLDKHDGKEPYTSQKYKAYSFISDLLVDKNTLRSWDKGKRYEYKLKKGYRSAAKERAEKSFDTMSDRFIKKNIAKIGPVIHNKKAGVKGISALTVKVQDGAIEGGVAVSFNDGSSFKANTKVVRHWTFPRAYLRFPTLFQDIVFPDGTNKGFLTEDKMNTVWAKA